MSLTKKTIMRENEHLLDLLGDIGGVLGILMATFSYMITWIAEEKILHLLSRKLFLKPTKKLPEGRQDFGRKIIRDNCFAYRYCICKIFCVEIHGAQRRV